MTLFPYSTYNVFEQKAPCNDVDRMVGWDHCCESTLY